MFRTLAAILLVSSAYASAQSTQVADDPKRLQGIWRVREVHGSDEAKAYRLQMHLAFELCQHTALRSQSGIRVAVAKDIDEVAR